MIENEIANGKKLCPRCGSTNPLLVPSLIPGVLTCGPGMCSIVGLPDQAPPKFVPRSRWKDWREYR